jgi:hypothetical protein
MTDKIENEQVLEHLRHIRASLDAAHAELKEFLSRPSPLPEAGRLPSPAPELDRTASRLADS